MAINYKSIAKKLKLTFIDVDKEIEKELGVSIKKVFETTEVKDSSGRLILPKGKVVDSNFTIPNPSNPSANLNPVVGISNYEYETRLNDEKRNIFIVREEYITQFLDDMRDIMTYAESSEYLDERTIQTENTNITLP